MEARGELCSERLKFPLLPPCPMHLFHLTVRVIKKINDLDSKLVS